MDYTAVMNKARRDIARMRRIEAEGDWASDEDLGPAHLVRTIMLALQAGITGDDWAAVGQAAAMCETLAEQLGQPWRGTP